MKVAAKTRKKKKEKFVEEDTGCCGSGRNNLLYAVGIVVVGLFLLSVFGGAGSKAAEAIPATGQASAGGASEDPTLLKIPLSKVNDGVAHFYEYPSTTGKTIRFFVLKSSDGVLRAAFDACDVCYHAKKGYSQDGDEMVCNNCGMRFPSNKINVEKGGCNPSPLNRVVEGDYLIIEKSDIEKGARYF